MTASTAMEEVYLFKRDEAEEKRWVILHENRSASLTRLQRLNHQHSVLKKLCYNSLLDPRISLDTLETVADVGTGTG
jgi:16S rRNA G527 N7-methylase RsmG